MKKVLSLLLSFVMICSISAGVDLSAYAATAAKSISLSSTSYVYNGKVRTPTVTAKDKNGKKISSKYYKVTYASGRKNVGKYKVTAKFKGKYKGTLSKSFTIKPKNTGISSLTAGVGQVTVKWNKLTTQTTGYQIQYAVSSNFSNAKTVNITKNTTVSKTISSLTQNKKYYFRMRTYKTVSSTKYYSAWSKSKSITTKFKLRMNHASYTLHNSEIIELSVSGGSGKVTWTSSNENVATVDAKGKVKGYKAGKCTITAKRGTATAKCTITVSALYPENDYVPDFGAYAGVGLVDYYYNNGMCASAYYADGNQWSDYVELLQSKYGYTITKMTAASDNNGKAEIVLQCNYGGITQNIIVQYDVIEELVYVWYADLNGYN